MQIQKINTNNQLKPAFKGVELDLINCHLSTPNGQNPYYSLSDICVVFTAEDKTKIEKILGTNPKPNDESIGISIGFLQRDGRKFIQRGWKFQDYTRAIPENSRKFPQICKLIQKLTADFEGSEETLKFIKKFFEVKK